MKSVIFASLLLGSAAMADNSLLKCTVPAQKSGATPVSANLTIGDDQSADFVTLNLTEAAGPSQFFAQMKKGEAGQQISQGGLQFMALTEQTAQGDDGVITNTGLFAVNTDSKGGFTGLFIAKGNIYPLNCTK